MTALLDRTPIVSEATAAAIRHISTETQAGRMTFPQGVGEFLSLGVESYAVDFIAARKTCYLATGAAHTDPLALALNPVAAEFSPEYLIAALRAAQADSIRYPEFVRRATAAGVIGYHAFLTGRRVVYLARTGEVHIEEFPGAK